MTSILVVKPKTKRLAKAKAKRVPKAKAKPGVNPKTKRLAKAKARYCHPGLHCRVQPEPRPLLPEENEVNKQEEEVEKDITKKK